MLRLMFMRVRVGLVASAAVLTACTSSGGDSARPASAPPSAVVAAPRPSPTTVLPVTVLNDTAVPVRVLCDACGASGFVLRSRARRTVETHVGDVLTYKRPGRSSCLLIVQGAGGTGFNNLASKAFLANVSQGGSCPTG